MECGSSRIPNWNPSRERCTMLAMSKKKQPDRHKKPRKSLQLPADWYAFAELLAGDSKMPVTWYVIDLLHKAAEGSGRAGMPPLPWKSSSDQPK